MIKDLTLKEFEAIKNDGVVIVDFYTEWCGDCKMMQPIYEKLANEFKEKPITFVSIDAEKEFIFKNAKGYKILKVPTFIVFKDGKETSRGVEYQPMDRMAEWLNEALK